MAIPNFITDTLAPIVGEYANVGGPYIDSFSFDPADYPTDVLNLPTNISFANIAASQKNLMSKIIEVDGRAEIFKNPFSDEFQSLSERLIALRDMPGAGVEANPLTPVCEDMIETLEFFETHTNLLCGVSEATAETQYALPTLERALAVGASLNSLHKTLDAEPTNAPQLALFSAFFTGKKKIDRIKEILAMPDSQISAQELTTLSQEVVSVMENDVKNYTVGLKKLRRASIASMLFSAKEGQVESELFKQITTEYTQGVFEDDTSRRNEEEVALTKARQAARSNVRANTPGNNRDFAQVHELFLENGLFEGIPLNWQNYQRLQSMYPADQPGILNTQLKSFGFSNETELNDYFNANPQRQGFLILKICQDYLSRGQTTLWPGRAELYFDVVKRWGSVSYLLANWGIFLGKGSPTDRTFEAQIQEYDNGPWRKTTAAEDEIIRRGLVYTENNPILTKVRLYVYGLSQDMYWWRGHTFPTGQNPLASPGPDYEYINGIWRLRT